MEIKKKERKEKHFIYKRKFNEKSLEHFKLKLLETSWDFSKTFENLNEPYNKTRKAIGFKFLRLNCSDVTQVNIKMPNFN